MSTEHEPTTLLQKRHCDKPTREMSFEGCGSSSKWSGPVRQHHSKSDNFPSCKRNDERECVQPAGVASGRKVILLHTWWLVKADPDSHGKRLGIGGYTLEEKLGMRTFCSASIVKKHDATTLQTVDGITVMVHGYLDRSRTLENGFSEEVCDHFQIGFPYYWEDFAALSDSSEEPGYSSASKGVSPSDAYKTPTQYVRETNMTPTQEVRGTNMMSAIQSMDSADHRATRARKKRTASSNLAGGGPLTRSRARCR
ncbi:hypothetical protein C2S53_007428 [Perilla frutescens var. hirtella]|uniref:SANTA domain-containing protein n=1 Tax=Perilla frutescens var. hirtella TaxID=608512 RepID=A0AAD4PAP0_PERFH|nr:hypothetical protein C2S53_007428 [Perilla frutescens var. hirtella]